MRLPRRALVAVAAALAVPGKPAAAARPRKRRRCRRAVRAALCLPECPAHDPADPFCANCRHAARLYDAVCCDRPRPGADPGRVADCVCRHTVGCVPA